MDPQVSRLLMGPRAKDFLQAYPEVSLDMVARDELGDMIAEGFDAAIRFGEPGASAVVARKLLDSRVVTCASRSYLEAHGTPKEPRDLVNHECIMFRNPVTGRPYEVMLIEWFVIEDGLIRRRWGVRDMVAMFGQMGLPLPAQAQA